MINKKLYDILKFIAQIALPALGTLYFTIGGIWGIPYSAEVVKTIMAIDAALGVLLGLSTASYNRSDAKYAGKMVVSDKAEGGKLYSLELNDDPEPLAERNEVLFKVDKKEEL